MLLRRYKKNYTATQTEKKVVEEVKAAEKAVETPKKTTPKRR